MWSIKILTSKSSASLVVKLQHQMLNYHTVTIAENKYAIQVLHS